MYVTDAVMLFVLLFCKVSVTLQLLASLECLAHL